MTKVSKPCVNCDQECHTHGSWGPWHDADGSTWCDECIDFEYEMSEAKHDQNI